MISFARQSYRQIIIVLCIAAIPAVAFPAGINPPSPTDEGRALLRARAYQLAMERFLLVEEKSENLHQTALALRLIGETQFRSRDYTSAYQAYQQSLRLNPISTGALGLEFKSAISLVYLKNYSAAIDKFKELEKRAHESDTLSDLYFWEAECYFQLEEYEIAGKEYGNILAKNPNYKYGDLIRYLQAWCFYQQKEYPSALEGFSRVLDSAKDETLRKLTFFQVAETQFRMEHYTESKDIYQEFIKTYPKDFLEVPARYGLGWTYAKLKRHEEAVETFGGIVANFPTHPLAPWASVRQGAEDFTAGDSAGARAAYAKGLELAKGKTPADFIEYGLGWLDYSDQQYTAAATHFSKVVDFSPPATFTGTPNFFWRVAITWKGNSGSPRISTAVYPGKPRRNWQ